MQPGYPPPGEDPYGQQQPYQDPYSQPQYGQQPQQPPQYGQPQYGDPNAQPPAYQDPYAAPGAPTSGSPYPTSPAAYPSSPAGYPAQPAYSTPGYGAPVAQNNTLGLVGMILGILSIPFALCCPLLGIPLGIGGAVTGGLGVKKANEGQASNRGMALAGLICGGVGIVIGIINAILGAAMNVGDFNV
jgi:hypothetical protein